MKIASLNGDWKLYYHPEEGGLPINPGELENSGWSSIPAKVPGNVELDLARAGKEKDPFFGENIYEYRKYEFFQWWFVRDFTVSGLKSEGSYSLRFEGLDTYATVWINGAEAGGAANMFVAHSLDVTGLVREGKNTVAVRIRSAVNEARRKEYPVNLFGSERSDEIVWTRKPASSFGWDIVPRFVSAGMWRDVSLDWEPPTRLREVYWAVRSADSRRAALRVSFRFDTDETYLDGFSVRIRGVCGESEFGGEWITKFVSDGIDLVVDRPLLWWPRNYGPQNLYKVSFQLLHRGAVVDERTENIGIRTVKIHTEYDANTVGEFRILVNGVPVTAHGTNWVPLDAFHSRDAERLDRAFEMVDELQCNIVRCWGGNVYEDHEFFDHCDRSGVMVWQDFAFACSSYPVAADFVEAVTEEASAVVRKLRNHPSIILWAGDNEIDQLYLHRGYTLDHAYHNPISREVLPAVVRNHDPYRYYLPSSPFVPADIRNDYRVPEQHNWGPRDYFKGDFYKHSTARFISEAGYHGCPSKTSLSRFISPGKMWPCRNDEWNTHDTDYIRAGKREYSRIGLMLDQVSSLFGEIPERMEDFILASQISQAEAKKYFIERVRLHKESISGIIWWNLLDCWPQISDAVVDYYFSKKLAYHYIRRSQLPVCVMMDELEEWHHRVVADNNSAVGTTIDVTVRDGDTGERLLEERGVKLEPFGSVCVGKLRALPGTQRLYVMTWSQGGSTWSNHYVSGYIPVSFERYRTWLGKIEALELPFSSEDCVK
jgi:beta-mannosidase